MSCPILSCSLTPGSHLGIRWPAYLKDPMPLYAEITPIRGKGMECELRMVRCKVKVAGRSGLVTVNLWLWPYECPEVIKHDLVHLLGFRAERIKLL